MNELKDESSKYKIRIREWKDEYSNLRTTWAIIFNVNSCSSNNISNNIYINHIIYFSFLLAVALSESVEI